jgi:hypothetical protein
MSQLGEKFEKAEGIKEIEENCPFDFEDPPEHEEEKEDYPDGDDAETAHEKKAGVLPYSIPYSIQKNNGGTLGGNLEKGSPGKEGTWNKKFNPKESDRAKEIQVNTQAGIEEPCTDFAFKQKRMDTSTTGEKVRVWTMISNEKGETGEHHDPFPFTVAAHHCIPGNEALKKSDLYQFMKKDGEIIMKNDKTFKIKANIGYNVNGSHNGVWLPGNYAMNEGKYKGPGTTWTNRERVWREEYIKAVVAQAPAQFHDRHKGYSDEMINILDELLCRTLTTHLSTCKKCKKRNEDGLPPPYRLIPVLFKLSAWVRAYLISPPSQWMRPLVASDQFREDKMSEEAFNKWKEKTQELYQQAKARFQQTTQQQPN